MVYVDDLFETLPNPRWPYTQACHLTADTSEELHAFAAKLGMRRSWAQKVGTKWEHYDLTPNKRQRALKLGAKATTFREEAERTMAPKS